MTLSPLVRLWLYISMAALPIWVDFFKLSTDYSLRGLAIPFFSSILAGVTVALARTASANEKPVGPIEPAVLKEN